MDMGKHEESLNMLESLIIQNKSIKKLVVTNLQLLNNKDIAFLGSLSQNKSIESLSLHFAKIETQKITMLEFVGLEKFVKQGNRTLRSLYLIFPSVSR